MTSPTQPPGRLPLAAAPGIPAARRVRSGAQRWWRSQPLRYLVVGGFNTLFSYATFLALYGLLVRHVHYLAAVTLITVVNVTTSFVTQRLLVFRSSGRTLVEYARFWGVYAAPIAFGFVAFPFCKEVLHLRWYVAQGVITAVTVLASYFGHKFISFRHGPRADQPATPPAARGAAVFSPEGA